MIKRLLLYQNPKYCLLYLGQFISLIGTMITSVALPYQVYKETHSTIMVGLLSLFQLLPLLATALLGGVLADRHDRRKLLLLAETFLAIACLVLMGNALLTTPRIMVIFVLAVFMAGITGLHRPALTGIVQQIVAEEDFMRTGAYSGVMYGVGMIVGPALGGVIIAHAGLALTFFIDFLSFIVSLILIYSIKNISKIEVTEGLSVWRSLKQGLGYARSRQELIGTYSVDFVAMIFGMPNALFPAMAQSLGGVKVLGLLYAAPAVGALLLVPFMQLAIRVKRRGAAVAVAASFWGVAIILFGLSQQVWLSLFFLAIAGGADAVSGLFRSAMWNEIVPSELRGRLAGIEMISYLSGPRLGDMEAGLVAAAFGVTAAVVSGGVLCIVGVAACSYYLPKFWRYRSA